MQARGARRARTNVEADPDGERFVRSRGFEQRAADRVSVLDLREAELPEPQLPSGFRLEPLGRVRDRFEELFEVCEAGEADLREEPETALTLEDWKLDDFGVPDISDEGSFVVLEDDRPVSLAFVAVDPERGLGYNSMTCTLRSHRRRGLALLAKVAAMRWAQESGLERLVTENDAGNVGMLAINDRLGYETTYVEDYFVRLEGKRPPG